MPVRLHDATGDDLGLVELLVGWAIELGDTLVDEHAALIRVERVALSSPESV